MELPVILEEELLQFLRINKATLYQLTKRKGLPCVVLNKKTRVYPLEKFMEWINQTCETDEN